MSKYYVNAGPVKGIIDRSNPREAALAVLKRFSLGRIPSAFTFVSEKGYQSTENRFETDILLKEIYNGKSRPEKDC